MSEQREISRLVEANLRSINDADVNLAATIWLTTPEVSFIHPRGHERGWEQVAENFYRGTMEELLRERKLELTGPLAMNRFTDSLAIVSFDWNFTATLRLTGDPLHTIGRESQVFTNVPEKGWRLVHVHYSGPPQTGVGQGF